MTVLKMTFGMLGLCALGLGMSACGNASFAGPPQGSSSSGRGLEPLVGATPFSFAPEMKEKTGFVVDHWFLNPGSDSNDSFLGQPVAWADGLDSLKDAGFRRFVTNLRAQQGSTPGAQELNVQFPMVMSFICQWFFRNADNSRPTVFDVFGRQLYSDSALDISFITSQIVEVRPAPALILIAVSWNQDYPSRGPAGVPNQNNNFLDVPLKGWTTPPTNDPAQFPQPFQTFTANQYNTLGMIVVQQVTAGVGGGGTGVSGGGGSGISVGAPIADGDDNPRVESIMSVPATNILGQQVAVRQPVGVFADNYAISYRQAPVLQPPQIDLFATPPRESVSINDADLEEALIEFSRHMAAVHTNLIGQAIGLSPSKPGTLMDPSMVRLQNRYEYRFEQDDISKMANKSLPGRFRDPTNPNP